MPNKRSINLTKYGVSKNRFMELQSFSFQYSEWKKQLQYQSNSVSGQRLTGMPFTGGISDPTYDLAVKRIWLSKNCQLVEQTLLEAITTLTDGNGRYLYPGDCGELFECMLTAVIDADATYESLNMVRNISLSRDAFYKLKRYYYYILDKNKK